MNWNRQVNFDADPQDPGHLSRVHSRHPRHHQRSDRMSAFSAPMDRRRFLSASALTAGALTFPAALLTAPKASALPASVTLPQQGVHDTAPAQEWTDGFISGNGEIGAVFYGSPGLEKMVLNHHRFVLPNGTRDMVPPVIAPRLADVQDKALAGDYWGATSTFAHDWELQWTQTYHPGYELQLSSPAMATHSDYIRTTDFRTGEVTHAWTGAGGTWQRRGFVSRGSDAIVHELLPPTGGTIDLVLSANTALEGAPSTVGYAIDTTVSGRNGYLGVRGTYPAGLGAFGFEGVTRVVITGNGSSITSDGTTLTIKKAARVLLLTKLGRYEGAADWNGKPLHSSLGNLLADYAALLRRHAPLHRDVFAGSTLDLGVSAADKALSTSEMTSRQAGNGSTINLALLERMYDSGRYIFACSSGVLPPRLTGIWAGSWNGAWADDFTTDANINLQVAGGNILSHGPAMQGYFDLVLGQLGDWRTNARNIYGARGFMAPSRTDGEHGHMLHFNDGDFPGQTWTGGADWMLFPLIEYYQVTGDAAFMKNKLGPALMELALFYEDFLTRTDANGKAVFVPSFSMENSPSNTGAMLSINATGDIMAGRHALQSAIEAATILHVESGPGQGIARWQALLAKLPAYRINSDEALAEWSWPSLNDRYNHRHVQHLYGAWPLHEIVPEDRPDLMIAASKALALRGNENYSAHGSLHRALAAARLKDGTAVYENIRKVLGRNMVWRSMMTSHNPDLHLYNSDAANAMPAILAEALIYSRPGFLELLPALPAEFARGTITGVRGRNRVLVESLAWDVAARTVKAVIVSDITQDITLACRRGIVSLTAAGAAVAASVLGDHARTVSLTAGVRTVVDISLLPATAKLVNRNSGLAMDVDGASTSDGGRIIQWGWSGGDNQKWQLVPVHDGSFRLKNVHSGKLLDNPGRSHVNGEPLDQWTDAHGTNQWWRLVPAATAGYYRLVNGESGLCLDVAGSSTSAGSQLVQGTVSAAASSQEWKIEAV